MRLLARRIGGIKVTLDDYLMLLALVSYDTPLAYLACSQLIIQKVPYWGMAVGGFIGKFRAMQNHAATDPMQQHPKTASVNLWHKFLRATFRYFSKYVNRNFEELRLGSAD